MNRFQKMRKVCKGYLERIPPLLIQSFQWGADWLREKILDLGEYLKRNSLRILALNTPYVIIFYLVDKEAWLYQYCQGDSSVERLMVLLLNFQMAFTSVLPSIEKMPLLAGFTGALAVKLLVMMKMKNAKKFPPDLIPASIPSITHNVPFPIKSITRKSAFLEVGIHSLSGL